MSNYNTQAQVVPGVPANVSVYADMMQVKMKHQNKGGGGIRGKCKGFSDDSRRRLVYKLAQWSLSGLHVYFITLTYPAIFADDWQVWKRDLDTFRKAIERRFPQSMGACWREEFQKRGAPHFHLILVCGKPLSHGSNRIVSQIWAGIVRDGYVTSGGDEKAYRVHFKRNVKAGTQVKRVEGRRQLKGYVSKYVAKSENHKRPDEWGRSWGFWNLNGSELDFAPVEQVQLSYSQARMLNRLIRRWMKASGRKKFAKRLSLVASFSALGLGAESGNNDLAYRMLGGVTKGLFKPHISPCAQTSGEELTFIERVRLGAYDIRQGLAEGSRVTTPLGAGVVDRIAHSEILNRKRCIVTLDHTRKDDGSKWAAFDLIDVLPVVEVKFEAEAATPVTFW